MQEILDPSLIDTDRKLQQHLNRSRATRNRGRSAHFRKLDEVFPVVPQLSY